MYDLKALPSFKDDLKRLDKPIAKRVLEDVQSKLSEDPKSLPYLAEQPKDLSGVRKLRVGDWRVLFKVDGKRVVLYRVDRRDQIYKIIDR